MRILVIGVASALALSGAASAQQGQTGTADQAKAMLSKAVAAIKMDQASAFANIDKGENGFREGDLYPYCFNTRDGKVVASPLTRFMGTDIRAFKDPTGNMFGKGLYAVAQKPEGEITSVSTCFQRQGQPRHCFRR